MIPGCCSWSRRSGNGGHGVGGTQDWRARRWNDTHQRIYDTAIRLFQERGFEQVSVAQIVSGAGVPGPTFSRTTSPRSTW